MSVPSLDADGDVVEKWAWSAFLRDEFPEYQTFWRLFVVGLTGRVVDGVTIGFRSQAELDAVHRPEWHVAVAQLHYTTLLHLGRTFTIRQRPLEDWDVLIEALARLSGATDTAFELLGRCLLRGPRAPWDPWSETAGNAPRRLWREHDGQPVEAVRRYRNTLIHGRVRVHYIDPGVGPLRVPSLDDIDQFADWRTADESTSRRANDLVDEAWLQVLEYLRRTWRNRLIPWCTWNVKSATIPLERAPTVSPAAHYSGGSVTPYTQHVVLPPTSAGSASVWPSPWRP